jgi:phospholipase/carboxylesterase
MPSLATIELSPEVPARASVIWLHGLGADGHDFEPIVPELRLPASLGTRFVFPHAPLRPITINQGYTMRAWYDVAAPNLSQHEDAAGIHASQALVYDLVEQEVQRGIPTQRIVLAGFSQGGAISLHTGLRYPEPLAGILVLSGYLPLAHHLPAEADPANATVPIMMTHGWQDPIIPLYLAEASRDMLIGLGYAVEWHVYPMGHTVCALEIGHISTWLQRVLA